jgi:hypothetical protein
VFVDLQKQSYVFLSLFAPAEAGQVVQKVTKKDPENPRLTVGQEYTAWFSVFALIYQ